MGCSSDTLRYHRKRSATGVLLHLSRDRGGYFGRVAKLTPGCLGFEKFLCSVGAAGKPHFLVRTCTIFGLDIHDPKGSRKTMSR